MTPPVAAPPIAHVWVHSHVIHLREGMHTGCALQAAVDGEFTSLTKAAELLDRGYRPCYRAECFPNGIDQYRAVA